MYLATFNHGLLDIAGPVYLADEGSSTPWGVLIDGEIIDLIDPPTFKTTAGLIPLPVDETDMV